MIANLRTLYNYRELLWMWTLREIKVRYKQSVLGAALFVVISVVVWARVRSR